VDGEGYGTDKEAARAAGVSVSTVSDAIKAGGREVKGHMITETPPKLEKSEMPAQRRATGILLRYPPGEGPLCQGSRLWR
jgi:hypothetical protein